MEDKTIIEKKAWVYDIRMRIAEMDKKCTSLRVQEAQLLREIEELENPKFTKARPCWKGGGK